MPGISEKPLQAWLDGPHLAIRYVDRVEIRRGQDFETVKWGLPCPIQEKLVVGPGHAYLVTPRGSVRALALETGILAWQKDLLANQIITYGQEMFATTFAQTCIGLDRKGRTLWTYEYGWGREPVLLPTGDWLVLHYGELDTRINAGWPAYEAALKAAGVKAEGFIYPGVNHGFHNDTTPRYDKAAADLSWDRTIALFKRKLT